MKVLVEPSTLIRRRQKETKARLKSTKKQKLVTSEAAITTLVMSSHVRGLECWHSLIRTGILPFEIDLILHVDSHPDMMLPKDCFCGDEDPRALYGQLESSQGGIAEWLLPAFYLGHCQRLIWLRAKWCDQLKDGESEFFIGKSKQGGALKVTSLEPYFADEPGMYSAIEDLVDPKLVKMLVISLDSDDDREVLAGVLSESKTWMLDLCLDYFAVSNPFLDHCITLFGDEAAITLRDGFLQVRWRRTYERQRWVNPSRLRSLQELEEKQEFDSICKVLLSDETSNAEALSHSSKLAVLYDNYSIIAFEQACKLVRDKGKVGTLAALELMESPGLPHHPELDVEQQSRFRTFLTGVQTPPSACIIAKSDLDEYTPAAVCQSLEDWVVDAMASAWPAVRTDVISVEVEEEAGEEDEF